MAGSFSEEGEFDALVELIQDAIREVKSTREEDVREWLERHMNKLQKTDGVIKAG